MPKLLLCLLLLLALPGSAHAQAARTPPRYLLLISRVQYTGPKLTPEASLITVRPDGTEEFEAVDFPAGTFEAVIRRLGPLRQAEVRRLNTLRAEGYTVRQMTIARQTTDAYEMNYLLEKP